MNLVFHQLRLEFRRSKIPLALYLLILLANYAMAAGWIGLPEAPLRGHWMVGNTFTVLFFLAYWIAFAVIVSNCVLADSPVRQDRFLRTRPLPPRSLLAAKSLYVLLAAVLPAAFAEGASVAAIGTPAEVTVYAALERAAFCAALALAVAGFAAHWKNTTGLILAGIVAFVVIMIGGRLIIALVRSLGAPHDPFDGEPTYLTAMQAFLVLGAGFALTAWVCSRRGRKFRYLIPALVPVLLAGVYMLMSSPWRTAPYRAAAQDRIDELFAGGTAETRVIPRGFQIEQHHNERELHANYAFTPVATGIRDDFEIRWSPVNHRWLVDGKVVRREKTDSNRLGQHYLSSDGVAVSWPLAECIQSHLGTTTHFRIEHSFMNHGSQLSVQSLRYLPEGPLADEAASVASGVVGDAFTWTVEADLPLPEGKAAATQNPDSSWKIAAIVPEPSKLRILTTETALGLHTAGDPNLRGGRGRWRRKNHFVLYLPEENAVYFGEAGYENEVISASAVKRYYGAIEFDHGSSASLKGKRLPAARLLVLRRKYVGRIETEFASAPFRLQRHKTHDSGSGSPYEDHEMLCRAEFALWFHRWEKLSPDEPASRVHPHLEQLLEQVARCKRMVHGPREPALLHAARFVPGHLDFMLEALPGLAQNATQFLVAAITKGAREEQRDQIIDAIVINDSLAAVAENRGWIREARGAYITMTRDYLNAGSRYTHKLLALDDPSLDPIILDSYRAHPQADTYEALRSIPRLAEETERITNQLWKPGRLVIRRGRPQGHLQLALLQGKTEALEELFTALRLSGPDDNSAFDLARLILATIQVPVEVRGKHDKPERIVKWALQHSARDFGFDPVFRRFRLKAGATTI